MTGEIPEHPKMSSISLHMFKDSGWYDVDFSLDQPLDWGKNMGCNFVNNECKDPKNDAYFCQKVKYFNSIF